MCQNPQSHERNDRSEFRRNNEEKEGERRRRKAEEFERLRATARGEAAQKNLLDNLEAEFHRVEDH